MCSKNSIQCGKSTVRYPPNDFFFAYLSGNESNEMFKRAKLNMLNKKRYHKLYDKFDPKKKVICCLLFFFFTNYYKIKSIIL